MLSSVMQNKIKHKSCHAEYFWKYHKKLSWDIRHATNHRYALKSCHTVIFWKTKTLSWDISYLSWNHILEISKKAVMGYMSWIESSIYAKSCHAVICHRKKCKKVVMTNIFRNILKSCHEISVMQHIIDML